MHQILIVGGGAGGLELATRLGDRLGRKRRAAVTLVDRNRTHVWKPLLHEVAAGSMDVHQHQLDYLAQARWHRFTFSLGALEGLDRARREITVGAIRDDRGVQVIPPRTLRYDTLVIAIGSLANPFGVPGVAEHAFALDSAEEADHFNRRLVNAVLRANYHAEERNRELRVVIVGGGATGVELAAELHNTTRVLAAYGLENIDPERQVKLTLLNADARILPGLPERISRATTEALEALGVQIHCNEQVVELAAGEVRTRAGKTFPADLTVWAAGIKASDVLREVGGLETNRLNQLVVLPTLQTTRDPDIFALGDCAACPWEGREGNVPPRAQAAHQQATHLVRTIERRLAGLPPGPWRYRDFGSLVSLGDYSTVGSLMGFISGPSIRVEGWFARLMYISLYKLHLLALHGWWRVVVDTLARTLRRAAGARAPLVVYYGGNAEELSWQMTEPWPADWSLALVNYRGYGESDGNPSEALLFGDALVVFDALARRPDVDAGRVVLVGRSLGSGVAVYVAAERQVAAVVLISPYDSMTALAQRHYPWLPVGLLLKHPFDSESRAPRIRAPLLAIAGGRDRIIPPAHSRKLVEAWGGPKRFVELGEADHNDISGAPKYWPAIDGFLREIRE